MTLLSELTLVDHINTFILWSEVLLTKFGAHGISKQFNLWLT